MPTRQLRISPNAICPGAALHLQYKIILPFLLLTLLVALAGAAGAFLLITSSAQERLNNQLAQAARATSDALVNQERANLVFLREIAFAGPNQATARPPSRMPWRRTIAAAWSSRSTPICALARCAPASASIA